MRFSSTLFTMTSLPFPSCHNFSLTGLSKFKCNLSKWVGRKSNLRNEINHELELFSRHLKIVEAAVSLVCTKDLRDKKMRNKRSPKLFHVICNLVAEIVETGNFFCFFSFVRFCVSSFICFSPSHLRIFSFLTLLTRSLSE